MVTKRTKKLAVNIFGFLPYIRAFLLLRPNLHFTNSFWVHNHPVWPDVELKRSPNFTVSSPKSSLSRYYLEWMFFKVAQKAKKYLDILWKIVSPKSSKNCPIWSHCSWWSPPQTYYIKILQTFPDIDQIQK